MRNNMVSISITDGIDIRKVAFVNIDKNMIVAGTLSQTGKVDVHATYHKDGHCHVKRKKEGELLEETDLFDGSPISAFKGKINLFNRLFPRDLSRLPYDIWKPVKSSDEITLKSSDEITLKYRNDNESHLMSIFLIESGRSDLLPHINKEEYVLYEKSSPQILVTFFAPSEDKWENIMKNLKQSQHVVYDIYCREDEISRENPLKVPLWIPPGFNRERDSVKLSWNVS